MGRGFTLLYQGSCLSIGNGSRSSSNLIVERSLGSRIVVGSRCSRRGSHHLVSEHSSSLRFAYLYFQSIGFFKSKNLNSLQKKKTQIKDLKLPKKKKIQIKDLNLSKKKRRRKSVFYHIPSFDIVPSITHNSNCKSIELVAGISLF